MKTLSLSLLIVLSLVLLIAAPASAAKRTTIHVYEGDNINHAVNTLANPGDIVIVHEGVYLQEVTIRNPVTLRGLGATIKTPFFYGISLEAPATVSGFAIKPLEENDDPQHGIMIGCSIRGAVVENNDISGFISNGIQDTPTSGTLIRNNKITSSLTETYNYQYVGIAVGGSTDTSVVGNVIDINNQAEGFGIKIDDCTRPLIKNNIVNTSSDWGIHLFSSTGAVVTGNEVNLDNPSRTSGPSAIVLNTVTNSTIRNNTTRGGHSGIAIIAGDGVVINSNTTYAHETNGSVGGIHIQAETINSTVKNNFIYGDIWEGILITQYSSSNAISGNTVAVTGLEGWVGIELREDAFNNTVKNNNISGVRSDFTEINDSQGLNIVKY